MDTPHIYVACLAAYNCGYLHGKWINAMQGVDGIYHDINNMLAKSPIQGSEEWGIHDYSGFSSMRIDEYECVETIAQMADFIGEHGELGAALMSEYSIDDAKRCLEDHYHGAWDCEVDFAQSLFEDCYSDAIPDYLAGYFDREAFSRDLFVNDYFSVEAQGLIYVFSYF